MEGYLATILCRKGTVTIGTATNIPHCCIRTTHELIVVRGAAEKISRLLASLLHDIGFALNKGLVVNLVLVDVKWAFGTVLEDQLFPRLR
jgi:hypothetical protein